MATPDLISNFSTYIIGLSKVVYNFPLDVGAQKIRGVKVRKVKKLSDLLSKTDVF